MSSDDVSAPTVIRKIIGAIFYPFEVMGNSFKYCYDSLKAVWFWEPREGEEEKPSLTQRLAGAFIGTLAFVGGSLLGGFMFVLGNVVSGPMALLTGISYLWSIILTGRFVSRTTNSRKRRSRRKRRASSAPPA